MGRDLVTIGVVAVLTLLVVVLTSNWLGSREAGVGAAIGAGAGAVVQCGAAVLLLRRRLASEVGFLGAFALAAMMRVVGGTAVVIAVLATGLAGSGGFLVGFGVEYVVLEVATDVLFLRHEGRLGRTG